ncbi:hypothetical protein [Bacteroides sp. 51]|uniref:hypothetical protein n=1 Tax=Bacteroides sp. 51 TaxID=2302938 RepID=UPI0013D84BC2|nr:hypothetical protein [Bacteroides sp. 51]NDV80412.1 hypothetical protein [Bacteroides sp. 51]
MKTIYLFSLLLFTTFTSVFANNKMSVSDVQSLTFDVSEVPFSRYGSYMSLIAQNKEDGSQELGLYDLTGNVLWDAYKRIMTIQPVHAGGVLPVKYTGDPVELKGKTKEGNIHIYYETPRVLHICSQGTDMQLSGNIGGHMLSVPGYPDSYVLYDRGIVLTARTGRINLSPDNEPGVIHLEKSAEGDLDIVVEQYYGDWVPKCYTENHSQSIDKLTREFIQWENNLPSVGDKYLPGKRLAAYINWSCVYEPRENITRFGMAMSKGGMSYIWSWDHCFNAMSLSYHQPELSWDQLMIMFDHQNKETGALPDLISAQSINWRAKKPPVHG